jgi:hypothetical protein
VQASLIVFFVALGLGQVVVRAGLRHGRPQAPLYFGLLLFAPAASAARWRPTSNG